MDDAAAVARIADAICEPARARMLGALMDNRARTATELALVAGVAPATASAHLSRLGAAGLVTAERQGKHRFYRISGADAAHVLERLTAMAGPPQGTFKPSTPLELRAARTCYDHLAGALGVALHDRVLALGWVSRRRGGFAAYDITAAGREALSRLGVDLAPRTRRLLVGPCLDWSERRNHLGGAVGAGLLDVALKRRWVVRERNSRVVHVTTTGRRALRADLGLKI